MAITKDNISIRINAVIYYKVSNADKAIIEVEHYNYAVSQLAQTTMRNAVGEITLDELLKNRDEVAGRIKEIVDKRVEGRIKELFSDPKLARALFASYADSLPPELRTKLIVGIGKPEKSKE